MAVVEQYPNLKADQQFIDFQREYTAIENSIRAETVNYNAAALNSRIQYSNSPTLHPVHHHYTPPTIDRRPIKQAFFS
jgi:hypothetical protein